MNEISKTNVGGVELSSKAMEIVNKYKNAGAQEDKNSVPQLKLHSVDSVSNKLANGQEPKPGQYFYTGNSQAYDAPLGVHIMAARSGWFPHYERTKKDKDLDKVKMIELMRANKVDDIEQIKDDKYFGYNMVIAGVIHGENEPFIMFLGGNSAGSYFDYIKEYTPFKNAGTPKWMLTTILDSKMFPNEHGKDKLAVTIKVKRTPDGNPLMEITDSDILYFDQKGLFDTLEDAVVNWIETFGYTSKEEIMSLIVNNPVEEDKVAQDVSGEVSSPAAEEAEVVSEPVEPKPEDDKVNVEDIPF